MLETRIAELTAAVVALTAALQNQPSASATVPQAALVAAPVAAPVAAFAAPAALPNGMPGGPFGTPSLAAVTPVATPEPVAGAPFVDLAGCTKYAMEAFGVLEAKGAGRGEVISQLIQHLCGSTSINDLPVAAYPSFYTELEKQKAA